VVSSKILKPLWRAATLELLILLAAMLLPTATFANTTVENVDLNAETMPYEPGFSQLQGKQDKVVRVYFSFGAEQPDKPSEAALRRLVEQANQNPASVLVISAHTDNHGWALGNLELSRMRAKSVAKALMLGGIPVEQLKAFAFGESLPFATNETNEGRRLNRRVEIRLTP